MGIKYLNKFLRDNCSGRAIRKSSISEYSGKIIVVDASIYLYKFAGENALLENIYLMVSTFREHNVTLVFVFDGKPPAEKNKLIIQRRIKKKEAEYAYNELKEKSLLTTISNEELIDIEKKLQVLKKQFIHISEEQIELTKKLLTACGVDYIDAKGEADSVCVQLVLSGKAWACLSDDMDMFVYGCPRIIRQLSLMNKTCTFYNFNNILYDLNMNIETFREIMVISGTDYNIDDNKDLYETLNFYYKYQEYIIENFKKMTFYQWLSLNTNYIKDIQKLEKVHDMFIISNSLDITLSENDFKFRPENRKKIMEILKVEGFL
jgi:flap endonuclease-1